MEALLEDFRARPLLQVEMVGHPAFWGSYLLEVLAALHVIQLLVVPEPMFQLLTPVTHSQRVVRMQKIFTGEMVAFQTVELMAPQVMMNLDSVAGATTVVRLVTRPEYPDCALEMAVVVEVIPFCRSLEV